MKFQLILRSIFCKRELYSQSEEIAILEPDFGIAQFRGGPLEKRFFWGGGVGGGMGPFQLVIIFFMPSASTGFFQFPGKVFAQFFFSGAGGGGEGRGELRGKCSAAAILILTLAPI